MNLLTISLLERIGLLLVAAFIITRIPSFKHLLDRDVTWRSSFSYSVIFGLFGIAGVMAGTTIRNGELIRSEWLPIVHTTDALAHNGLVGIVIAGLLGGPIVGLGAGFLTGIYHLMLGEITAVSYAVSSPIIGILAGLAARFFSQERVISPAKSLFIGLFSTILTMCFVLVLTKPLEQAKFIVNEVGIPMVISNSLAIAIFTIMIRIVLNEKEQAQALETKRALTLAERVLPYLKQGLTFETAHTTASLIMKELGLIAVAVSDTKRILAHVGLGADHHQHGSSLHSYSAKLALSSKQVQVLKDKEHIQCAQASCPLGSAIHVPFSQSGQVAGLIMLYYKRPQQIRMVDLALAQGLAKLITNQLNLAEAERLTTLMHEAELRTLQAQINPHFLFNTLNSIVTLIRLDPGTARTVTLQLAQFMRSNLKMLSSPLIPLQQEINHIQSYLELIKVRFADRITIHFRCDDDLMEADIPPSTLQPLVENSIQHGLKNRTQYGQIWITIKGTPDGIILSVEDNGTGIDSDKLIYIGRNPILSEKGNGVGLYNVNQRLIALLGDQAALKIRNRDEGGCHNQITIPYRTLQKE